MNRFDEYYVIRHAHLDDTELIMNFIRDEWPKKNHILSVNKDYFLYEFQNGELINFVIAINKSSNAIDGIMGYNPASNMAQTLDIWTCMWLTRRKGAMPLLGLEILTRMKNIVGYRHLTGIGVNTQSSLPIARDKANHHIFTMKHYYRLSDCTSYKVAKIEKKIVPTKPVSVSHYSLKSVKTISELSEASKKSAECSIPLKNEWYINKRYFCHPVYRYCVWEIVASKSNGILVGREIDVDGTKILRIVDFIGIEDLIGGLYDEFQILAVENGYEYIDFYIHGVEDIHLINSGFTLRTKCDPNVIPNYFEPFLQENVEIYCTSDSACVRICKADADQDRPNFI